MKNLVADYFVKAEGLYLSGPLWFEKYKHNQREAHVGRLPKEGPWLEEEGKDENQEQEMEPDA